MKKIYLFALLLFISPVLHAQSKKVVNVPEGAAIKLVLMQRLDSGDKGLRVGDKVKLQAAQDVVVGGKIIIDKFAEAEGHIIEKVHSKWLGRRGKIDFEVDWVKAVDGTKIPLRSVANKKGKSHVAGMVAVAALVSPIGLFIRGKNAVIKRGTNFTAFVNTDTKITVK